MTVVRKMKTTRRAWGPRLLVAALGLGLVSALALGVWRNAPTAWAGLSPGEAHAPLRAKPLSEADASAAFMNCQVSLSQRNAETSRLACASLLSTPSHAARAHAVLAAAYAVGERADNDASARHALEAARLGDDGGRVFVVLHAMRGNGGLPFDINEAETLLAGSGKVPVAAALMRRLDESRRCREREDNFNFFGEPVFCMYQPELRRVLEAAGIRLQSQDTHAWRDRFRTGNAVEGAERLDVQYDRDPEHGVLTPVELVYSFPSANDAETMAARLRNALGSKYGTRLGVDRWRIAEVDIELRRGQGGTLELRYVNAAGLASARRQQQAQAEEAEQKRMARLQRAL